MNEIEEDYAMSINLKGLDSFMASKKVQEIHMPLRKYMLYNNFTALQMKNVFSLLNEFCKIREQIQEEK